MAGVLGTPLVVGQFTDHRGEFYDQEDYKGAAALGRSLLFVHMKPVTDTGFGDQVPGFFRVRFEFLTQHLDVGA
jgi:hypothetical protein